MAHSGSLLGERDGLRVIDCEQCSIAHLDPLPDAVALVDYYRDSFWQNEKAGALEQIEAQWHWLKEIYGDWLGLVGRHTLGRTLLDVGCGYGQFMLEAQTLGWQTRGIELSHRAVAYAKAHGAKIHQAGWPLDWPDTWPARFDAITALWLIEHLPEPLVFLRWCSQSLYGGGVLLVAVPNDFSTIQAEVNKHVKVPWYWLHHTHLNYFDWASSANLLGRAGFRIVERQTQFPMEKFLVAGFDYTDNPSLGADCHRSVEAVDLGMTRADRIAHYAEMAQQGRGRELICVCVKE